MLSKRTQKGLKKALSKYIYYSFVSAISDTIDHFFVAGFISDFLTAESSKDSPLKTCHKVISAHLPARSGFTQVPEKTIGLFHTLLSVDSAASPLNFANAYLNRLFQLTQKVYSVDLVSFLSI